MGTTKSPSGESKLEVCETLPSIPLINVRNRVVKKGIGMKKYLFHVYKFYIIRAFSTPFKSRHLNLIIFLVNLN